MKSKLLLCTLLSVITVYVYGQSAGDYRSKQSGNWSAATSWERFDGANWVNAALPPTSTDGVIAIRTGHSITVNVNITADQVTVETSATLTKDAHMTLNDGPGDDLRITGTMYDNSGVTSGTGNMVVAVGGILNFSVGTPRWFAVPVTNNGTMNWQNGTIYCYTTTITNAGTFNITGNELTLMNENNGAGVLVNTGTITKSSTSLGITKFQINAVSNSGTINLNNGTFQNVNPFTNTGTINLTNGASFINAENMIFNHNSGSVIGGAGSFTNNGTMNLNIGQTFSPSLSFAVGSSSTTTGAGNLTINNNFTMHGTIDGTGSLLINGNITWRGGTLRRPLTIAPANSLTFASPSIISEHNLGAAVINNGTMNWQDGTIRFKVNGILTNNGNFNISSDDPMLNENFVSATFTNAGTITKTTTSSNRFVLGSSTVPNSGIINTSSGIIKGLGTYNIETSTPFINNGTIAPGLSPGILTIDNQQPLSASSTLSMEIAGNGGAGQPTGHDQLQRSGNLTLSGTLAISETGTVPVGDYTIISLTSGTISGTFTSTNLPANYSIIYNTNSVVARKGESVCSPAVLITAAPSTTICSGLNVMFTATPTNGGTPSYQWKLNGNNVGTNSNTYSNATLANGDQVSCIMTSSLACASPTTATSNLITMAVTPSVTPSVSIAADPGTNICQVTPVTFTATPTNGGATPSYQWKLNGNNVGTNSNTYTATGLMTGHQVSCVMTSSLGCASPVTATSNTLNMTVTLLVTSSVSISSNQGNTICEGTNVTFTAMPTNGGATPSFQWYLNGSTVGTNSNTYSNSGLANGDEVVVAMTSSLTCVFPSLSSSNVIRMNVTTAVAPSVSISANPGNTICAGTNVIFTATPTNGGTPSYQWKLNNNNVGTNSNTYSNTGLANGDQVSCVMTSSLACASQSTATSNTIAMNVTASVVPSVSIAANPGNTICSGTNVIFTATPTNGGSPSYQWKLNGNNVGTNSNTYSNDALVNGDQVSCVMTSSLDCGGSLSVTSNSIIISISSGNINASIVFIGNKNRCPQTLQANPGGDVSYQWYKNGIEISGATDRRYVANNDGSYTVSITKNGCSAISASADVTTCVLTQTNTNREITREEPAIIPQDGVLLYPNPAADQVTVNFQAGGKVNGEATVQLVTMHGQVLITQKVHVISGRINCTLKLRSTWRDQLYLVKVITPKKMYVGKLAKIVR